MTVLALLGLPSVQDIAELPFKWLADAITGLYKGMADLIDKAIINPPNSLNSDWVQNLSVNGLGLSKPLIILVTYVLLLAGMISRHKLVSAGHALFVGIVIAVAGELWLPFLMQLNTWGSDLAQAMNFYHGHSSNSFFEAALVIKNVLGAILGLGVVASFGAVLIGIIFMYQIIIAMVAFLGLPSFAISPLGDRAKQWLNRLISLGLVALLFGRAAAVLAINVGKALIDSVPLGSTPFGATMILIVSIATAIAMQFWLIKETHRQVVKVAGNVGSNVSGNVKATLEQRQPVSVRAAYDDRRAGRNPVPTGTPSMARTFTQTAKIETSRRIVTNSVSLAKKVATKNPAA